MFPISFRQRFEGLARLREEYQNAVDSVRPDSANVLLQRIQWQSVELLNTVFNFPFTESMFATPVIKPSNEGEVVCVPFTANPFLESTTFEVRIRPYTNALLISRVDSASMKFSYLLVGFDDKTVALTGYVYKCMTGSAKRMPVTDTVVTLSPEGIVLSSDRRNKGTGHMYAMHMHNVVRLFLYEVLYSWPEWLTC